MIPVSERYKNEMAKPVRGQSFVGLEIEVIDPNAAADIVHREDNGHVFYSGLDGIEFDRVPQQTYATFEPGRWLCDGSQLVPGGRVAGQGYVGSALSRADGTYAVAPAIRFDFGSLRSFAALTLTFDATCGDWPARVRATGYRGGSVVVAAEGEPDDVVYELIPTARRGFTNVDSVVIEVLDAGKPYRRARLQRVVFGYIIYPGMEEIASLDLKSAADPISRTLPTKGLSFSLLDFEGRYDPDNPEGIWRDMEERIPIRVYMGNAISEGMQWDEVCEYSWGEINRSTWRQVFAGRDIEAFLAGSFYLDSLPSTQARSASFSAGTVLELLDKEYYKAPPKGATLYSHAQSILEDASIPRLASGEAPWQIWEGLREIECTAPLPLANGRELLQLIANAARCTLYVDRFGIVQIQPFTQEQLEYTLSFENIKELPNTGKTAALGGVYTSAYSYIAAEEVKELHSGEYSVAEGETVLIKLPRAAQNVKVQAGGGTARVYARAVEVTFAAAGTYEVVITGNEVEESCSVLAEPVADARPTSAWAELDNPLVTSRAQAARLGRWFKNYLLQRTTYSLSYRGNPEIEALDRIFMQTRFTGELPAYVLEQNINYNGAFSGNMLMKKVSEG